MGRYKYLTFKDRKQIEEWYLAGDLATDIAARLGVCHPTIYRELERGSTGKLDANFRGGYSAAIAEKNLQESFKRRGKKGKKE